MYPIYRFYINYPGALSPRDVYPIYKDDLAIDYALEQNQQFYRGKLNGKLTFEGPDYDYIVAQAFDTKFTLEIQISRNAGVSWSSYWTGEFWKTDCEFDGDAKTVVVTPATTDRYTEIMNGLEKEFNLIELAPAITPINLFKRPAIQVYVPGQTTIGCFLSGMWWEQECEAISSETALRDTYHFRENGRHRIMEITGQTGTPTLPQIFMGDSGSNSYTNGDFRIDYTLISGTWTIKIYQISTGQEMWNDSEVATLPHTFTLTPVSGGGTGTVSLYVHDLAVFCRRLSDVAGASSFDIPANDLCGDNRNYHYVTPYTLLHPLGGTGLNFSSEMSSTPTEWGLYRTGQYYKKPVLGMENYPVARSAWGPVSIWFPVDNVYDDESDWMNEFTLRDAYPISSVISVLLAKIAPNITHSETTAYSKFLYGLNPIAENYQRLFITPKSNIIHSGDDQPAQTAPITLKKVFDMLRDCYRCYWFIDGSNRLRIEHISYFMKGGSYTDMPTVGINLTEQLVSRSGKAWAFARNQFKFDKPDMTGRYEFGWMDDVSQPFNGAPMDIVSGYVQKDKIEHIDVASFTSDIDYILLNPGAISSDGFVLMAAESNQGVYTLPFVTLLFNLVSVTLQNGWTAFAYLQRFYAYDMPAPSYLVGGVSKTALGTKKLKTQTIKFPVITEPDFMKLVKTEIGEGVIQKMSVNLSSRNANTTLKYDTEQ